MGLLDDAIREHLELKRRHGADPGEITRLEREAFGAREAHEAAAALDPEPGAEAAAAEAVEVDVAWDEPSVAPVAESEPAAEAAPEPVAEPELEPAYEPEPPPRSTEPPAPAPPPEAPVEQPTRQFSVEELEEAARPPEPPEPPAPAAEPAPPGEEPVDELEGTPEFLEETPEHDRLWFEQKPPKDFDF